MTKDAEEGLLVGSKRGCEESKGRPGGRKAAKEAVRKGDIQLKRMRKMDDLIQAQKEKMISSKDTLTFCCSPLRMQVKLQSSEKFFS